MSRASRRGRAGWRSSWRCCRAARYGPCRWRTELERHRHHPDHRQGLGGAAAGLERARLPDRPDRRQRADDQERHRQVHGRSQRHLPRARQRRAASPGVTSAQFEVLGREASFDVDVDLGTQKPATAQTVDRADRPPTTAAQDHRLRARARDGHHDRRRREQRRAADLRLAAPTRSRTIGGVDVTQDSNDPNAPQTISLRGHDESQTAITLDGIPLGAPGSAVEPALDQHRSVHRAPGVSFGAQAGALGGSVNFRTLQPTQTWQSRFAVVVRHLRQVQLPDRRDGLDRQARHRAAAHEARGQQPADVPGLPRRERPRLRPRRRDREHRRLPQAALRADRPHDADVHGAAEQSGDVVAVHAVRHAAAVRHRARQRQHRQVPVHVRHGAVADRRHRRRR